MLDVGTAREAVRESGLPRHRGGGPDTAACEACTVRHLTICAPLARNELEVVARIGAGVQLDGGETLFAEGDDADRVFSVTHGMLKTYKLLADGRRQITGFLIPGDVLGLAESGRYAYGADALTRASLCSFDRQRLEQTMERYPKMEHRLLAMTSHEIAAAHEQMLLLGRKTAREKIASFLLDFAGRARSRNLSADPLHLPMSRSDLGDFLGLTMETVSRTFTKLRKEGVITLAGSHALTIVDPAGLRAMAGGE